MSQQGPWAAGNQLTYRAKAVGRADAKMDTRERPPAPGRFPPPQKVDLCSLESETY